MFWESCDEDEIYLIVSVYIYYCCKCGLLVFRIFKIYEEIKIVIIINCRCYFWKIYDYFEWVDGEDENIF